MRSRSTSSRFRRSWKNCRMLCDTFGPTSSACCSVSSSAVHDRIQAAECLGQNLRGSLADERNAQAIQHARQRLLARRVDVPQDFLGRLLPHAFELQQLLERQIVNIRHALDQAARDQLVHQHVAHAIDIHDAARGEMRNGFLQPRRAVGIDAAAGRLALFAHDLAAAHRAMLGHAKRPALVALAAPRAPLSESRRRCAPPARGRRSRPPAARFRPRCAAWRAPR